MMTVLTHTHTDTHTTKQTHKHTPTHTYKHTHTHPHTPTPTHTYTHPHPHPHTHTSRRRRRCKCRRTHTRHAHLCSHAACCVHNTSTTRDHACAPVAPTNQLSTTSAGTTTTTTTTTITTTLRSSLDATSGAKLSHHPWMQHQGQHSPPLSCRSAFSQTRRCPSLAVFRAQASLCSAPLSKHRCVPRRCPSLL